MSGIVPFDRYPGLSPLFLEFLRGLPEFFPDPPSLEGAAARGKKLLGTPSRIGPADFRFRRPEAAAMAEDLIAGRAVAVVTGHQVGLFTGPVFTVTKAFDCIRVAKALSAAGVPAVPVFWALTDDHDLEEIARTARPGPEGPEILVLEGKDRANRQPVGSLPIPASIGGILDAFRADARGPWGEEILAGFAGRYSPGASYADAFIETLFDLVEPEPLLVLDPSGETVRERAREFFLLASERRADLQEALRQIVEKLERQGKPVPVAYRPEVFPFFVIDDQGRRRIESLDLAIAGITRREAWPSTDVLTRPIFKSWLMPIAASVLGAAEIAYHAQALPLAALFDVPAPVLLPRSHLVLVGPRERRAAEALGIAAEDLLSPTARGSSAFPEAEEVSGLASSLEAGLAALEPRVLKIDPTLSGSLETVRRKVAYQFEHLAERIRKAAEKKDEISWNRRKLLKTMLLPGGTPAERLYPPLVPMLAYGRDALEAIRRGARGQTEGAEIVDLGGAGEKDAHAG